MKKLLFLFVFCLSSLIGYAQPANAGANSIYINEIEEQYKREWPYIGWTQQYPVINCQPSFLWSVTRSKGTNQYGQQLYKFYFKSTSKYCNGLIAGTYINGITLYLNDVQFNQTKFWINFRELYQPPFLSFWWTANQAPPRIFFSWDYVNVN